MSEHEVSKETMVRVIYNFLVCEKRFFKITEEDICKISVEDLKPAYEVIKTQHCFATEITRIVHLINSYE